MNVRWLLLLVLVSWAATCGQKGPLELPERSGSVSLVSASAAFCG